MFVLSQRHHYQHSDPNGNQMQLIWALLTSYHLPLAITFLSLGKNPVGHNITTTLMKLSVKALLKSGDIGTFHLALFAASEGVIVRWHRDTMSVEDSPRKMYPMCNY